MSKSYVPSALRQIVYERAGGCCEYCLLPEMFVLASHEIDHIIAEKHGGLTNAENLALSCVLCNKHKGSDIASVDPETGNIVPLYNPRQDRWKEIFILTLDVLAISVNLLRNAHISDTTNYSLHPENLDRIIAQQRTPTG